MLIWAPSLMLLSPTLQYSWSFPCKQLSSNLTLTSVSWVCCQRELACFSFLGFFPPFPPPKSIQIVPFAAICSLPLGLMLLLRCPWHGALQGCLCSSAFLQLLAALLPPCPRGSGALSGAAPPLQSALCPFSKPKTRRCFATFQYFLPKYSHAYRESTCRSFGFLACFTTNAKYVCDKTAFSYGKWASQRASQTPHCVSSHSVQPSGGSVMVLQWAFIWI